MGFDEEVLGTFIQDSQLLLERCMQAGTRALSEVRTVLEPIRLRLELPRMGSQHLQPLLERGSITITQALRGSYAVVNIAAILFLTLWLWRIWRFTIRPWLSPEQPRELPYWIPVIGEIYNPYFVCILLFYSTWLIHKLQAILCLL